MSDLHYVWLEELESQQGLRCAMCKQEWRGDPEPDAVEDLILHLESEGAPEEVLDDYRAWLAAQRRAWAELRPDVMSNPLARQQTDRLVPGVTRAPKNPVASKFLRRLFGGDVSHGPSDPTGILDEDELEPCPPKFAHALVGASFLPSRVFIGQQLHAQVNAANQFNQALQNVAAVFIDDLSGVMQSLTELTVAAAEPERLNQRRHGAAATCPRHGETRGGLCRKCSR